MAATLAAAPAVGAPSAPQVVASYADLAHTDYAASLDGARALQAAVDDFLVNPTPAKMAAAREAWKRARVPYALTEAFRFGNPVVDEWEPRVNSWPLDEGLIDYVAAAYGKSSDDNPLYTLNVIANPKIRVGAKMIDATRIDVKLLDQLNGAEGVKTNVATGYHAIEFLLWGQDLHGTGPGAGERPASDYDTKHCTHGNCARRRAYLKAATDLLVSDLAEMTADWAPGGRARADLGAKGDGALTAMLVGIGSLSYGELAGERMKLGLILHDPEEEQDCFSDNTHNEHYGDELGMIAVWHLMRDYAVAKNPATAKRMDDAMAVALAKLKTIKMTADSGRMAYDQMIGQGNIAGNAMVQDGIDALVAQTRATEGVMAALGLKSQLQGSENFENPGK